MHDLWDRWNVNHRASATFICAVILSIGGLLLAQEASTQPQEASTQPQEAPQAATAADRAAQTAEKQPAIDRYGDPLPPGALLRLGSIRFRHPDPVTLMAVDPEGGQLITFCQRNPMLRRCDLATGRISDWFDLGDFRAVPNSRGTSLAFDPSGKRLIAISTNSIQAVDVEKKTKSVVKSDLQQGFVLCSGISADGKLLALVQSQKGGRLLVIDTQTGTTKLDIENAGTSPTDIAFTHDAKALTITTHNQAFGMRSWSLETGKSLPQLAVDNTALSLAYSANGKWLALGNAQTSVLLIDLATKTLKHSFGGFASALTWVEFTPDSKRLLAYDISGQITVLDPERQVELRKISSGPSQAPPIISPTGATVITAAGHVVDAWNIETGEPLHPFAGHHSNILQSAISPEGSLGATVGQDHTLRIWDLKSGEQLFVRRRQNLAAPTVVFSADGRRLLWANSNASIEFLDITGLLEEKGDVAVEREIRGNQFAIFAISDDGRTLAASNSTAGGAQIWDLTQEKPAATIVPPTTGAQSHPLAYSPDLRLSATRFNADGIGQQLVIADVARSREITRLISPGNPALQGVFAGSRLVATRAQRQVSLWDVLSGKTVVNVGATSTTAMTCLSDGRLLAWAERDADRTIRLYDSLNAREIGRFSGHVGDIQCLELCITGKRPVLISGSHDSTALVWDLHAVADELRRTTPQLSSEPADRLWADLGAEDAAAMHRASWVLAAAGDEAVALLSERLQPVPVDQALGAKVTKLVEQMDDDLFSAREQASQQAAELGEAAEPHLLEALKTARSAEVRHRIRRLLAEIATRPVVLSSDQQRSIRAVYILEQIGGSQSREIFQRLAKGQPSARLTQEAKNALARMGEASGGDETN